MSSAGQVVGGIVGGIVGFFAGGNVMLGVSIGMAIGGAIDPPKGPKIEGPRLSDLSVQGVGYGTPIPRMYGTLATMGTIFWIENNSLKETASTEEQGGKGGSTAEVTNYSYSATFAVGICQGPIEGIKRIWISGKLVYDAADSSVGAITMSRAFDGTTGSVLDQLLGTANNTYKGFTLYKGDYTQQPNPRMQATLGIANVPAYRGLAYIVFEDFQLEDFGNSLMGAQIKVEVIASNASTSTGLIAQASVPVMQPITGNTYYASSSYYDSSTTYMFVPQYRYQESALFYRHILYSIVNGNIITPIREIEYTWSAAPAMGPSLGPPSIGYGRSDVPATVMMVTSGDFVVFYGSGGTTVHNANTLGFAAPSFAIEGNIKVIEERGAGQLSTYLGSDYEPIKSIVSPNNTALAMYLYNKELYRVQESTIDIYDPLNLTFKRSIALPQNLLYAGIEVISETFIVIWDAGRGLINVWDGTTWSTLGYTTITYLGFGGTVHLENGLVFVSGSNRVYVYGSTISSSTVPLSTIVSTECLNSKFLEANDLDVSSLTSTVRGYKVTQNAAIRGSIEPLQASWPFDVVQAGYKIKFVPRGQNSVMTINHSELGATTGEDTSKAIKTTTSREMDLQLPQKVEITYLDISREYDQGEQYAERLNTDAINTLRMELAIALSPDEAAQKAEILLYMFWLERHNISFVLPPLYNNIEPADVITLVGSQFTNTLRIVGVNILPDGRIECEAKLSRTSTYTSSAVGSTSTSTAQVLYALAPTLGVPLDIPCINDVMNTSGILVAAMGLGPGWSNALFVRSLDGGVTWSNIGSVDTASIIGTVSNVLPTGRTDIIDHSSYIEVLVETGSFYSISESLLLNGANYFAIGNDGRWEIIAAKTVVENTTGRCTLKDLLRGRFGTEWAMSTHKVSDYIIQLSEYTQEFQPVSLDEIGSDALYRAVSSGQSIDAATDIAFSYDAVNLECLSPVYLNGRNNSDGWTIYWIRRTRIGGEWRDNVDATLGESTEFYEIDIYSNSSFTTVKRTLTSITSNVLYTTAQMNTDFGSNQTTIYLKVYQISDKVGRGYPLTGTLTRPLINSSDPNFAYLKLGLHMDGTNGSTTFTDVKGRSVTPVGAASISTTQSVFGGSSGLFNGTTSYLSLGQHSDWDIGANESFTIRCWVYLVGTPNPYNIIWGSKTGELTLQITGGAVSLDFPYWQSIISTGNIGITTGAWYFIEAVKSVSTFYIFVNGILRASGGSMTWAQTRTAPTQVGRLWDDYGGSTNMLFPGYIEDFQYYKGVALYTTNHSVPSEPFSNL